MGDILSLKKSGRIKTVEGSLAFATVTFIISLALTMIVGYPLGLAILIAVILGFLLMVVEGSLGYGLDNFFLPIIASALAVLLW